MRGSCGLWISRSRFRRVMGSAVSYSAGGTSSPRCSSAPSSIQISTSPPSGPSSSSPRPRRSRSPCCYQTLLRRPADIPLPLTETLFESAAQVLHGRKVGGLVGHQGNVHQRLLAGEELGELDETLAVALAGPGEQLPAVGMAGIRRGGAFHHEAGMNAVHHDGPQVIAGLFQLAGEEEGVGNALLP